MAFEFHSENKEGTRSIHIRVPERLHEQYEAEAAARTTTVADLVLQAMRYAYQEAERSRRRSGTRKEDQRGGGEER